MQILLVHKHWRGGGGVESHLTHVRSWFASLGHDVIPFAMTEDDSEPAITERYFPSEVSFRRDSPTDLLRAVERATISRETITKLRALLAEYPVDSAYVLHVYHQLGTRVLNELHRRGIPTVLSVHDYKMGCPNYLLYSESTGKICTTCLDTSLGYLWAPVIKRCWGSAAGGAALTLEAITTKTRRSYSKASAVIVLNELQRRTALRSGVKPDRIFKITHPIHLAEQSPYNIAKPTFLYVGRLSPEKGLTYLIEAAALSQRPVVIIGDGRQVPELRSLAAKLNAPVEFKGQQSTDVVCRQMRHATALVIPSVCHDVSPLVLAEATSVGLPVIGTAVGGIADQLRAGRGILVPPNNTAALAKAMDRLAQDDNLRARLVTAAREYAAAHSSPQEWADTMRKAFRSTGRPL